MDISELEKIILPVQTRNLIHAYSDREACVAQVKCLKMEEMLASKLKCLIQPRHSDASASLLGAWQDETGAKQHRLLLIVSPSIANSRHHSVKMVIQLSKRSSSRPTLWRGPSASRRARPGCMTARAMRSAWMRSSGFSSDLWRWSMLGLPERS
jgi:hypothetical protein